MGVSHATVNRWENGRFWPSRLALRQVEAYCDGMIERGRLPQANEYSETCQP